MPLSEIVTLLTALTSIVAVVLAFVPQWWARRKVQAETATETAQSGKVKAEASAILVDSTMALAARLDEQILSLIGERDVLKRDRDALRNDFDKQYLYLHTEIARTQEQLAIMLAQFDECKKQLDLVVSRTGGPSLKPSDTRELN